MGGVPFAVSLQRRRREISSGKEYAMGPAILFKQTDHFAGAE
jgi:hypothetical protein